MDLDLHFEGLDEDLVDAVARVQLQDLAMAGVPGTGAADVGPFAVASARPSVTVSADLPGAEGAYQAGLTVRVRGRAGGDGPTVEYLNTTATPLPQQVDGPVRVRLERIR